MDSSINSGVTNEKQYIYYVRSLNDKSVLIAIDVDSSLTITSYIDTEVGMYKIGTVSVQDEFRPELQSRMNAISLIYVMLLDESNLFLESQRHYVLTLIY